MDKVLITGGWGFLGSHIAEKLKPWFRVVRHRHKQCNLVNQAATLKYIKDLSPNIVVHAAGHVGANFGAPGEFFYDNLQMGVNVLEASRVAKVNKVVMIGTVCSYPDKTKLPFKEDDLWKGFPEATNASYGIAKRVLITMGTVYAQQYGMSVVNLIPANLYGPGDCFEDDKSHVIPALIKRLYHAKKTLQQEVQVWGSGDASREFLFIRDCADAIALAVRFHNDFYPINIGTGISITIRELVEKLCHIIQYGNLIHFNQMYMEGQRSRCLSVKRAKKLLGFEASTSLEDGLKETVRWYEENHENVR
jgi:GDP-L-fucose synthase